MIIEVLFEVPTLSVFQVVTKSSVRLLHLLSPVIVQFFVSIRYCLSFSTAQYCKPATPRVMLLGVFEFSFQPVKVAS